MQDWLIEKEGKQFVDVVKLLPDKTSDIREIVKEINGDKVLLYSKIKAKGKGKGSKKILINRMIELDDLFFEGLGLWQAEGSKDKGLYFGNTCLEILLRFLEFAEQRFGLPRNDFKITLSAPIITNKNEMKKRWSEKLNISIENFTDICLKQKTNLEFIQFYINSIILIELIKNLHEKLKDMILQNQNFAASYMRGIIAGESQVSIKPWGTMNYVTISSGDLEYVEFYKDCLETLDITSGIYQYCGRKFPIYGKRNFDKIKSFNLLYLHPNKNKKFDAGMKKYKRIISNPKEIEKMILQKSIEAKTYTELSKSLNKGKSTIQSFYIPRLESKNFIKRIGKQKQAWLFQTTKEGINFLDNLN